MCLNNKHILEVTFIEKLSSYINLNKLKSIEEIANKHDEDWSKEIIEIIRR